MRPIARWMLVLLFTLMGGAALGDGMMLKKGSGSFTEAPATIPSQRAVIKWQDGVETLFVESVVSGPQGVYGWVIPLPSKPLFAKSVDPDYIAESFRLSMPPVETRLAEPGGEVVIGTILMSALWLTAGYRYRRRKLAERIALFLLENAVLLALGYLLMPVYAQSQSRAAAEAAAGSVEAKRGVSVESLGNAGSYAVQVVSGDDSTAILDWFRANGYPVPRSALPVIEKYVREKWVFATAEIRKDKPRDWPAHPLKVVFKTETPIYPMRLTGTQSKPMRLEAIVVAEQGAALRPLHAWSRSREGLTIAVSIDPQTEKEALAEWRSGLFAMARPGETISYLRADLRPDQMDEDYRVEWVTDEPFCVELWSREASASKANTDFWKFLPFGTFFVGFAGLFVPHRPLEFAAAGVLAGLAIGGSVAWAGWRSRFLIEGNTAGQGVKAPPPMEADLLDRWYRESGPGAHAARWHSVRRARAPE